MATEMLLEPGFINVECVPNADEIRARYSMNAAVFRGVADLVESAWRRHPRLGVGAERFPAFLAVSHVKRIGHGRRS